MSPALGTGNVVELSNVSGVSTLLSKRSCMSAKAPSRLVDSVLENVAAHIMSTSSIFVMVQCQMEFSVYCVSYKLATCLRTLDTAWDLPHRA